MKNPENFVEKIKEEGREYLLELEKTNNFVFHGSGVELNEIVPKQAFNHSVVGEKPIEDGEPAVFASPFADIAIFMAIINKQNIPKKLRSGFGGHLKDGEVKVKFRTTKETIDQLNDARGYVYVFNKNDFTPRSDMECMSHEPVKPVYVIKVTEKDLPIDIEIKDF